VDDQVGLRLRRGGHHLECEVARREEWLHCRQRGQSVPGGVAPRTGIGYRDSDHRSMNDHSLARPQLLSARFMRTSDVLQNCVSHVVEHLGTTTQSPHGRRKSGLPTQADCLGVHGLTQVTLHRGSPLRSRSADLVEILGRHAPNQYVR